MLDHPQRRSNHAIGDEMAAPKNHCTTRIHFQNVNGINTLSWPSLCETWMAMEADIILVAEHKLDTLQPKVMNMLHRGARNTFGHNQYAITAASSQIQSPTMTKQGGKMALLQGRATGRNTEMGNDEHGRCAYVKLQAPTPITIICTYQAVEGNPRTSGPTTTITQLYSSYVKERRPDPANVRKHHTDDIVAFVKASQRNGELVILAGDFNEELGKDTRGLTRLCSQCNLVDTVLSKHHLEEFATQQTGSSVIDYILVDPRILPHVLATGYEPFKAHIISDHRGIFIDISTSGLLGDHVPTLAPIEHRDIQTKKVHQIPPYFNDKHAHLEHHQWFRKIVELKKLMEEGTPDNELAEDLYNRLISASQYAGSRTKSNPSAPFSPELAALRHSQQLL